MEQIGQASGGHPNLNLTAEEKRVYTNLFKEADPDGFGAVSGDVAVKFFERTRLPPDVLGQIWQIADTENRGFLTPAGFGVVLRLIGHAQAGRQPSLLIAPSPAPVPKFDSPLDQPAPVPPPPPAPPQPILQQATAVPANPPGAPGPVRVPALTPDKVAEYAGLFEKSGAENGLLSGFTAKSIFERAKLPNDVLGRIWNLADTQGRGSLDVTEFVIAMHLLASYKSGTMRGVPSNLPPGLLDAASRRTPIRLSGPPVPGRPGSSAGLPPQLATQPQATGYRPQSPIVNRSLGTGTPLSAHSTGEPWLISAVDKARFDSIFATVDTAGQGFISGEQAVQFFGNARLAEEVLAHIWDLADINSDGVLNRDEFAVAMYLIRQQRGSRDGQLPQTLPTGLVPPSMRKQVQPSQPQTIPTFDDARVTKPRSAADDLFGLDVSEQPLPQQPVPQPAPPQVAQSTGGTDAGPFATPKAGPGPTSSPPPSNLFKPFVPSSQFGQGLLPQATGAPAHGQRKEASLMDDEEEAAPKINDDAAELGNLSTQVGNLSKQMQDVHGQRVQAEAEIAQTTQQKTAFQQRLTQLRAAYDQEVAQVKSLKDQLAASQAQNRKLQQEMAMLEGTHADLQTQHQQLATALQADQQENATLKERIRQTNAENEQLKPQLEKLKSDARQQKGLVAINKKQLATNEAERDRLRAEIAAAQQELETAKRQADESAKQVEQSHHELQQVKETPMPAPVSRDIGPPPNVASPTPSTSSNPFFRRQESGAVFSPPTGSNVASPAPHEQERNSAFDSIFGPAVGSAGPAPITSFGDEHAEPTANAAPDAPKVVEPPAPPAASQIDSSALPIRHPLHREDSISSSVQPQPPASRLSPSHSPRAFTPETSTASPSSHRADDPFTSSAVDEEQESVRQTLPRGDTTERIESVPGAFPASRSDTPAQRNVDPKMVAVGAGAAAVAAGAGMVAATAAHEEEKPAKPAAPEDNFDDIFGGPSHKKTLSEQHADFDSAFASMDSSQAANGQPTSSNPEFPDIQELDDDDDSSDDQSDARGFDDNFAPASSGPVAGRQADPAAEPSTALVPPPLDTHASSSSLPGIESQQSPPGYKEAVPEDNPTHFPREYKNLLPEREDPTAPPPTAGGSTHPGPPPAGQPPAYGPEAGSRRASPPDGQVKAAPFDFDSAFANMGSAPLAEESESDYDDHTPEGAQTSHAPVAEFDPSFDSPAPSTRTTNTLAPSQHAALGQSAHDAVTSPTTNGTVASPTGPTRASFADFDEATRSNAFPHPPPQTSSSPTTSAAAANPPPISHDWDALFAPLDSQTPARGMGDPTSPSGAPLAKVRSSGSVQQSTEIAPGLTAVTTADEVQSASATPSPIPAAASTHVTEAASLPQDKTKLERPQPGRALSEGTEHDDPILKRLTAMGWSRQESLEALEKFDYNIDKAADYLTFQS